MRRHDNDKDTNSKLFFVYITSKYWYPDHKILYSYQTKPAQSAQVGLSHHTNYVKLLLTNINHVYYSLNLSPSNLLTIYYQQSNWMLKLITNFPTWQIIQIL